MGIKVTSTGSYVPKKILSNLDLEKMVETSDEWITTRTGIKERRISETETTSEMALKAAKRTLKGLDPSQIGLIVVGTATPDMLFPSTACQVQAGIGNTNAIAFDVSAACTGFIYGLYISDSIMRSKNVEKSLVIGVERFSRITDWEDRSTCVLFGDGAGCALLEKSNDEGIMSFDIGANGKYGNLLYVKGVGSNEHSGYIKMKGNEVFKVAVRTMVESSRRAIERANISAKDIKLLIPHQANIRIMKAVAERLSIEDSRIFVNVNKYGNTSAASIPIALDEAVSNKILKKGDIVLLTAFGGGFTWGSCLLKL